MCIVYDISLYTWIGIGLMYPSKHGRDESPVSLDVPTRLLALLPYHFPFFICKCQCKTRHKPINCIMKGGLYKFSSNRSKFSLVHFVE